jgi:ribosome-binding factor A
MTIRVKRVGEEIKKVISEKIVRGLRDPLPGFVTIREVEVNRDFTLARVFYSVIGTPEEKEEAGLVLKENRGFLRSAVGKKVRLRNTPDLIFEEDDSGDRAARIHELLRDAGADQGDTPSKDETS